MAFHATIKELIESSDNMEISYRNLHGTAHIKNQDTIIRIPYKSLTTRYMDFFNQSVVEVELDPDEVRLYQYKPKALSLALYGTTELWDALLQLNNCISLIEFNLEGKVKLYAPEIFRKLLNEAMILEGIIS